MSADAVDGSSSRTPVKAKGTRDKGRRRGSHSESIPESSATQPEFGRRPAFGSLRRRGALGARRPRDTFSSMDFRLTEEQELLRRTVREFAETEMRPHVMEWDEAQHFPMDLLPKLADLGLMGIQFAGGVRRRRHVGGGLLHLHRGARPRLPRHRAVGRGAQRAVHLAHRACSAPTRRSSATCRALVTRRGARRVGPDRGERRQRRRRHAHHGRARRRRLGAERHRRTSSRTARSAA